MEQMHNLVHHRICFETPPYDKREKKSLESEIHNIKNIKRYELKIDRRAWRGRVVSNALKCDKINITQIIIIIIKQSSRQLLNFLNLFLQYRKKKLNYAFSF